jgi:hypothetical protein
VDLQHYTSQVSNRPMAASAVEIGAQGRMTIARRPALDLSGLRERQAVVGGGGSGPGTPRGMAAGDGADLELDVPAFLRRSDM